MSNPENPNFDDQQNLENPQDSDLDFSSFLGNDDEPVDLDSFADLGTSEAEELAVPGVGQDDVMTGFSESAGSETVAPVVEDKKSKKGKKEKPPKKEKAPKVKKEKEPKTPGEKQPWDAAALCFVACLLLMLAVFGGVNAYVFMKHGMGALTFLAIFDVLALGALVIPILLRRDKENVTAVDVSAGMSVISLIIGCMFLLANLAYNLG